MTGGALFEAATKADRVLPSDTRSCCSCAKGFLLGCRLRGVVGCVGRTPATDTCSAHSRKDTRHCQLWRHTYTQETEPTRA
jgi:hypothetical protein